MNTGKLCIFTNTGKMHQVKILDVPYGKFRDKGQPIDNVSNYDSTKEEIVYICDAEQMRYAKLLFVTGQGMLKKVEGLEFQVAKRTIAATKLQDEDTLVSVQVISENQNVVLQTKDGYFLRFPSRFAAFRRFSRISFSPTRALVSTPSSKRCACSTSSFLRSFIPRTPIAPFFFSGTSSAGNLKKYPSLV